MHKHTCGNGHLAASNSGRVPVAAGNVFDAQPFVLEERGAALHPRSTEELHWRTILQKCGLGLVHVAGLRVVNSDGVLLLRLLIAADEQADANFAPASMLMLCLAPGRPASAAQ